MVRWSTQTVPVLAAPDRAKLAVRGTLWQRLLLTIERSEPDATAEATHTTRAALSQREISDFELFFRAHERDIFTYLWRMTGDEHAAYDLAQETFLRAWQQFARVRTYERPGGWLFRVATNLALNHLRSRATPLGAAASLDPKRGPNVGDFAASVARTDAIRRALMALAPRRRAALVLREVYGLPCEQIGTTLGISTGAAKTELWRARDEFRACYLHEEAHA